MQHFIAPLNHLPVTCQCNGLRIEFARTALSMPGVQGNRMAVKGINGIGFLLRLLVACVLVFSTYNPSGYSYYHLLSENISNITPTIALFGVLLLVGWTIFLRATLRSLGAFGLLLAAAFLGVLLWMMIDWGWFDADNLKAVTYLILVVLSGILAIGVSWSHIRRRITGQVDVDDVEGDI
jgi:hypothetical protein